VIQPRSPLLIVVAALALMGSASLSPLEAQELPRSLASLSYIAAEDTAAPFIAPIELGDSTPPRTYWLEGALVAGVPFALLGAGAAGWACSEGEGGEGPCWDNELLGAVFGFGIGASFGALVGGQFKKGKKDPKKADQPIEPAGQDSSESIQ
jgi:hypothetical protein